MAVVAGTLSLITARTIVLSRPLPLVSNVVYRFTCPCDTGRACIDSGMSSRRLVTSAKEHSNLDTCRKGAIKDHLQQFNSCFKSEINLHSSFTVLKKRSSEYKAKIHSALLIKQSKPLFNEQLHANCCSSLLKLF